MTNSKGPSFDPAAHLAKHGWKGKGTGGSGSVHSSSLILILLLGRHAVVCIY
jgi:hypothetical protein